jgi:hypothetical protein
VQGQQQWRVEKSATILAVNAIYATISIVIVEAKLIDSNETLSPLRACCR